MHRGGCYRGVAEARSSKHGERMRLEVSRKRFLRDPVLVATFSVINGKAAFSGTLNLDDDVMKVAHAHGCGSIDDLYRLCDIIGSMKGYRCELVYEI